uniref:Ubiquitin carboxyl-terminal hydrolase MINDY n=1 Tax=Gasterosteus aculeatus aculeatus TaxID=481459 RepID=G3P710_GASAC|nr:probable ubiquitin carboxyl-terminal hydrolase MINDY-4 [Gasterosteus aculeatus aculeatus]
MTVSVEDVSSSVVREYLSRKGLKRTIACMDEEHPRTTSSINNRSQLRQLLNIEGLYRNNKAQISPLKTLLEMIVKHHIEGLKNDQITISKSDSLQSAVSWNADSPAETPTVTSGTETENNTAFVISKQIKSRSDTREIRPSQSTLTSLLPKTDRAPSLNHTEDPSCDSEAYKHQPLTAALRNNESVLRREAEKTTSTTESTQRTRINRTRRGMIAGPIASTLQEANKKKPNRRLEVRQQLLGGELENKRSSDGLLGTGVHQKTSESGLSEINSADCLRGQRELWSAPDKVQREKSFEKVQQDTLTTTKVKSLARQKVALDVAEMVLDDIDDDEDLRELSRVSFQRAGTERSYAGRPMDQHTATELKVLLLGSSCFSVEWRNQGFAFSETHDLRYGIVQKKGGPCGVLASMQAFVLKKLLFENVESSNTGLQRLRPSNTTRRKVLASATAEILWRAGEEKQATIAINSGRNHFTPTGHFKSEGVFEKITCFTVDNIKDLQALLEQHIDQFETGVSGCILLTISAVLSRSIEKVRGDMDVPTATLIGAHSYCTQELVNLFLCGRAVSNVFDDDMELDSGHGNMTLLKGVKGPCDVGLLSLFEHYNICKVGVHLKTPRFPIWVVCSESHFSVLFGLQRELLTNRGQSMEFELYYYDGLANQQEEIRLTVSVGESALRCQDDDTELIPPLEHCIRTRWKNAIVNWNDTEPIL